MIRVSLASSLSRLPAVQRLSVAISSPLHRAYAYMLLAMVIWGINITSVKVALQGIPPMTFGLLRYAVSSVFLFALLRYREGSLKLTRHELIWLTLSGMVGLGLNQVTFLFGVHLVSASLAAIILASAPVLTAVTAAVWSREPVRSRAVIALAVSIAGVIVVIVGGDSEFGVSWLGGLLIFGAAACLALGAVLAKPALKTVSSLRATSWLALVGGIALLPLGAGSIATTHWTALPAEVWYATTFTIVGSTIVGNLAWNNAIRQLGAARTVAFTYLQPITGIIFAALLLGEHVSLLQAAGAAVVLGGQFLFSRPSERAMESTVSERARTET